MTGSFSPAGPAREPTPVDRMAALLKINPDDDACRAKLASEAVALIEIAKAREKEIKAERARLRDTIGLSNMSPAQLRLYFHGSPGDLAKRDTRGLAAIAELARAASSATDEKQAASMSGLLEVMAALRNNSRPPVPDKVGPVTILKFFNPEWRRHVGKGTTAAANLRASAGTNGDLSQCEPEDSTFWKPPPSIASQNLYAGFGREQLFPVTNIIWQYDGPKTSSGTRPGFDVEHDGARYQIKFGEVNSEPFTARIFHAMGYNVDPTDYTPQLMVRYDRRLLHEFNMRKSLPIRLRPFGLVFRPIQLQPRHDPFDYIMVAVFKDGHRISGVELKQVLFDDPRQLQPEDFPNNFRKGVESALDYLVMAEANVQPKDTPMENIGSWEFGGLGHESRRELRGAGLLAAWLGWCDTRWDNTRLRVAHTNGNVQLEHFFSDLGNGMGEANGSFMIHGENPNEFKWTFTRPEIVRGPGRMTTPFRIVHFRPIVPTPAFREMTTDDARWMARRIGQFTEAQLRAALIASGYDAAEVKLYQEKLVSRRDQMIRDLGLSGEIPVLRQTGVNRQFSFDPAEEQIGIALKFDDIVPARASQQTVEAGKLVNRPQAQ